MFIPIVLCDLIQQFNITDYPLLRIKSDNCGVQYSCSHIFKSYQDLAKELAKTIILYGVNGHGKGLVDAMSDFGVKDPLRRAIITRDFMFNSAHELENFLRAEFQHDNTKVYATIPDETLVKV